MSNTYIHKEHIKYMHGLIDKPSNKLQRKWDRHNFEVGERRHERNKNKLKAIELADKL